MRRTPAKTDLIIGMTLAEIFLLILVVVWWSQGAGSGPDWQKIAEQRQIKITDLQKEIEKQKKLLAESEAARKWWQENFQMSPPSSREELMAALRSAQGKSISTELARDYPPCLQNGNNTIVEVTLNNGEASAKFLSAVTEMRSWYQSRGIKPPQATDSLSDKEKVEAFLGDLTQFYSSRKTHRCRFDYRLNFVSSEDYRYGRQKLETVLYPAGVRELKP